MRIAIIYASLTGNTELIANKIRDYYKDKVVYLGKSTDNILEADIYFIGSWTNKGDADENIKRFLKTIKNKKIGIFGTAGYGGDEKYFKTLFNRVSQVIDNSNKILGYFYCQGRMPLAVKERYIKLLTANPDDKNLKVSLENFNEAMNHPNADDFKNLENWLNSLNIY